MNQTPYSRTRDNVTFFMVAVLLLIALMASSCHTQKAGCAGSRGYVGYGNR